MNVFEILLKYHRELLSGIGITLNMCLFVYPIGFILGTLLGVARFKWKLLVGFPVNIFSIILSSMPIIVFLFWLHYPLQYLLDVVIDPFITSVCALSILMVFLVSDTIENSLKNFPLQLLQSAKVCGLTNKEAVLRVQLPIIYRQVLPSFLFIMVNILQATLFTSLISVNEIFRVAQQINADIYKPVEIYTTLAFFFILICASLNLFAYWLKSRYKWQLSDL